MDITGKIIKVLPVVSGTSSRGEWKKQEFVLEYGYDQQFPKKMLFGLWKDKVDTYNIQEGQELTVSFDIDCHEYNGRWFNNITAWRVTPAQYNAQAGGYPQQGGMPQQSMGGYPQQGGMQQPVQSMDNSYQPSQSFGSMPTPQSAPMGGNAGGEDSSDLPF